MFWLKISDCQKRKKARGTSQSKQTGGNDVILKMGVRWVLGMCSCSPTDTAKLILHPFKVMSTRRCYSRANPIVCHWRIRIYPFALLHVNNLKQSTEIVRLLLELSNTYRVIFIEIKDQEIPAHCERFLEKWGERWKIGMRSRLNASSFKWGRFDEMKRWRRMRGPQFGHDSFNLY